MGAWPGRQRRGRRKGSHLDPASAARRAGRTEDWPAGHGIRCRRQLRAGLGRRWCRLRLALVGARHLRRSEGLRLGRRSGQRRSDSDVHQGRQVRHADREGRPEEDEQGHEEFLEACRRVRLREDERTVRRRRLRKQTDHRIRRGYGCVQAHVGCVRKRARRRSTWCRAGRSSRGQGQRRQGRQHGARSGQGSS